MACYLPCNKRLPYPLAVIFVSCYAPISFLLHGIVSSHQCNVVLIDLQKVLKKKKLGTVCTYSILNTIFYLSYIYSDTSYSMSMLQTLERCKEKHIFFFNDWKTDHLNQLLGNCKFMIKKKNLFKSTPKWLKWRNAYNQFRSDKCRESNSEPYDCIKEPWIASKELVGLFTS